jgi:nucleolar GTP-binding protein
VRFVLKMPLYNFKTIGKVPEAKDFIDIILSKTQRKTPTVVRRGWKISRVRSFYMRKVKFTQTNYSEKLTLILDEFPRLDDIHPFYADLVNVLYSRDHYKLALGQISTARQTIDTLGKDYLRMLKMGDSLYRCKQLKRAAMGRMCTCMKKLQASLSYLEQVRMHLSRLPSINPDTRTLMITGYPNVGKSSFINRVSRADVDVQPYAFTTKSLFVGHCDYKYSRWQVIDTPGILDHPLEDRNTIEMQAITALAHLQSTVLYFMDISESCGYSIKMQVSLFHNIKPLFANKPLLIVVNKIDLKAWEDVDPGDRALIEGCAKEGDTKIMQMSNQTLEGIESVKEAACNLLLMRRVERKLASSNIDSIANRISVMRPTARDHKQREVSIPQSVQTRKAAQRAGQKVPERQTLKDVELLHGGPGIFNFDLRNHWQLTNSDWKFDAIPEFMDGKNVADFIDPEIEARLEELEAEEAAIEARLEAEGAEEEPDSDLDNEERALVGKIRAKRKLATEAGKAKRTSHPMPMRKQLSVDLDDAETKLQGLGYETTEFRRRALERDAVKKRRRESRNAATENRNREANENEDMEVEADVNAMDVEDPTSKKKQRVSSRSRSKSVLGHDLTRARSTSKKPRNETGQKDAKVVKKVEKLRKKSQKGANQQVRKGEGDRHVFDFKPKHLFSGKRNGMGTADWR